MRTAGLCISFCPPLSAVIDAAVVVVVDVGVEALASMAAAGVGAGGVAADGGGGGVEAVVDVVGAMGGWCRWHGRGGW